MTIFSCFIRLPPATDPICTGFKWYFKKTFFFNKKESFCVYFGTKKRPLNQPNEPRLFLLQPVVCSALSFCRSVKMCQTARLSHRTSNHTIPSLACLQSCLDCSNLQCALIKSIFVPFTCKRSLLFFFFPHVPCVHHETNTGNIHQAFESQGYVWVNNARLEKVQNYQLVLSAGTKNSTDTFNFTESNVGNCRFNNICKLQA